jgi:hypothetical protein
MNSVSGAWKVGGMLGIPMIKISKSGAKKQAVHTKQGGSSYTKQGGSYEL